MSTEHSHRLSTSSASCISSTMSIDDIQILSTSPAPSTSTSSNTNGSLSSSLSAGTIHQFRVIEFDRFEKLEISLGLVWPVGISGVGRSEFVYSNTENINNCSNKGIIFFSFAD
jgi:hypothetical protein